MRCLKDSGYSESSNSFEGPMNRLLLITIASAYFDADVDYCKAKNLEILVDKLIWKP